MGAGLTLILHRHISERIMGGVADWATMGLTDFDKRGDDERQGRPKTYGKFFGGVVDFFTANAFDLDKSGDFINSREDLEKMKEKLKERRVGLNQGSLVFDNDNDTSNNNEDSVPAILTPGEFVVTKDAVDKVGVDALKGLNASVGATNKASNLGSFSIQKLDPNDLSKDALVKKSSFIDVLQSSISPYTSPLLINKNFSVIKALIFLLLQLLLLLLFCQKSF